MFTPERRDSEETQPRRFYYSLRFVIKCTHGAYHQRKLVTTALRTTEILEGLKIPSAKSLPPKLTIPFLTFHRRPVTLVIAGHSFRARVVNEPYG